MFLSSHGTNFRISCQNFCSFHITMSRAGVISCSLDHHVNEIFLSGLLCEQCQEIQAPPRFNGTLGMLQIKDYYSSFFKSSCPQFHKLQVHYHFTHFRITCQSFCSFNFYYYKRPFEYSPHRIDHDVLGQLLSFKTEYINLGWTLSSLC